MMTVPLSCIAGLVLEALILLHFFSAVNRLIDIKAISSHMLPVTGKLILFDAQTGSGLPPCMQEQLELVPWCRG